MQARTKILTAVAGTALTVGVGAGLAATAMTHSTAAPASHDRVQVNNLIWAANHQPVSPRSGAAMSQLDDYVWPAGAVTPGLEPEPSV